ncbi:MAG: outer membrane protein assembly factor BamD [Alphaproteobacteria bacterium]
MRPNLKILLLAGLLFLAACSSSASKMEKPAADEPVETLYNRAGDLLDQGDYRGATKNFEEVERQHPYSQWAIQAQLMAAYASYESAQYDDAIMALDRFMELHPGSENIDYALYLKSLCYYEQISDVGRDQAMTTDALNAFETLIRRFPDSKYTRDAILKRDLTLDHLAGKEMTIGRYYQSRGEINAAINRFRNVVKSYQTTTHVTEALHRLVECYLTLGLKDEAVRIASVLGFNYPGSAWYKRSYELMDPKSRANLGDDRSFMNRTMDSLFTSE